MWPDSIEETLLRAAEWLSICGKHGIILNPSKFIFAQTTTEFAGFEITLTSVCRCPQYLEAIQNFSTPCNITDVRSWFGLVQPSLQCLCLDCTHAAFPHTPQAWHPLLVSQPAEPHIWGIRGHHHQRDSQRGGNLRQDSANRPLPLTEKKTALDFDCSRNTALTPSPIPFAARLDGGSLWLGAASRQVLSPIMLQWRGRPQVSLVYWTRSATSSLAAPTS